MVEKCVRVTVVEISVVVTKICGYCKQSDFDSQKPKAGVEFLKIRFRHKLQFKF